MKLYLPKKAQELIEMDWSDKRVFITGVTGLLGSHLAEELANRDTRVACLVRDFVPGSRFWEIRKKMFSVIEGDVTDYSMVERGLGEYEADFVFHLAAQPVAGVASKSPLHTFEANIKGAWNVLEACRHLNAKVVFASSYKVYDEREPVPYVEDCRLGALHPYDASKACADMLARTYFFTYGLPVVLTRCANLYGPGDLNFSRIIPNTMRLAFRGEAPQIFNDGSPVRDFMFVSDAVSAYLACAENVDSFKGEAFNFGSENRISTLGLVNKILEVAGRTDLKPVIHGKRTGANATTTDLDQYTDFSKAEEWLGWKAHVGLDDGLKRTWAWYSKYFSKRGLK